MLELGPGQCNEIYKVNVAHLFVCEQIHNMCMFVCEHVHVLVHSVLTKFTKIYFEEKYYTLFE